MRASSSSYCSLSRSKKAIMASSASRTAVITVPSGISTEVSSMTTFQRSP